MVFFLLSFEEPLLEQNDDSLDNPSTEPGNLKIFYTDREYGKKLKKKNITSQRGEHSLMWKWMNEDLNFLKKIAGFFYSEPPK